MCMALMVTGKWNSCESATFMSSVSAMFEKNQATSAPAANSGDGADSSIEAAEVSVVVVTLVNVSPRMSSFPRCEKSCSDENTQTYLSKRQYASPVQRWVFFFLFFFFGLGFFTWLV